MGKKTKMKLKERQCHCASLGSVCVDLCISVFVYVWACMIKQMKQENIMFDVNKHCSSIAGAHPVDTLLLPIPLACAHLGKIKFELLAVELGLVQLDASAGCGLWGAEADPDSPEAFEHLEGRLFIVDPKQRLKPLLQRVKNTQTCKGDI